MYIKMHILFCLLYVLFGLMDQGDQNMATLNDSHLLLPVWTTSWIQTQPQNLIVEKQTITTIVNSLFQIDCRQSNWPYSSVQV